jgi:hypothetical protein
VRHEDAKYAVTLPQQRVTALIAAEGRLSPPLRREAAAALLRKPQRISQLLNAIERQKIPANDLDAATSAGGPLKRGQNNQTGRAVLDGVILAGRRTGDRIHVEYQGEAIHTDESVFTRVL